MTPQARLSAVREELARQNLAAFIVPRADEHLGEYVPPSAERLAWLTGFTGSAGLAIVSQTEAAIWSDGRYVLQLATETDPTLWTRLHLTDTPPPAYLAAQTQAGAKVGYDPWLMSDDQLARFREAGLTLAPVTRNPIDAAWPTARPHPPPQPSRTMKAKPANPPPPNARASPKPCAPLNRMLQ